MTWRVHELVSEAARNLRSSPLRSISLAFVFTSMFFAASSTELVAARDLVRFERLAVDSGSNVVVATSESIGVPSSLCTGMEGQRGVRWAGTLDQRGPTELKTSPGVLVQTASATPGAVELWTNGSFVEGSGTGPVAGTALASELGLVAGSYVQPTGGQVDRLQAVVDTEARNPAISRWLVAVNLPDELVDQCWVEFEPGAADDGLEYMRARFANTAADVSIQPWIRANELSRQPLDDFERRSTRYSWLACAVIALFLSLLVSRARRGEIGLYRSLGTTWYQVVLIAQLEMVAIAILASVTGFAWSLVVFGGLGSEGFGSTTGSALALTVAATGAALAVTWLGPLVAARGSVANQVKGD